MYVETCVQTCVRRHVCRHVCRQVCRQVWKCLDMHVDMCADMCVDICADMCGDTHTDMHVGMCIGMCEGRWMQVFTSIANCSCQPPSNRAFRRTPISCHRVQTCIWTCAWTDVWTCTTLMAPPDAAWIDPGQRQCRTCAEACVCTPGMSVWAS